MYLLKLISLFCCLTIALCQFSLAGLPKSQRNSSKEPKINSPNSIIQIKIKPNSLATFSEQPISSLNTNSVLTEQSILSSTSSPVEISNLTKRSPEPHKRFKSNHHSKHSNIQPTETDFNQFNGQSLPTEERSEVNRPDENKLNESIDLTNQNDQPDQSDNSNRSGRFGFGDLLKKPKFPNINAGLQSFENNFKPDSNLANLGNGLGKLADQTANKFKIGNFSIISDLLKIPSHFRVNDLKGAIDYMIKYGHLENSIDISKPEDLLNLSTAFLGFQNFFGLKPSGIFDQETLNLMNKKRCGLPDKETKFTKFAKGFVNKLKNGFGLIRKKRYEIYQVKYETRNISWSIIQFSKKALKNQDQNVIKVFEHAFKVWTNVTNLNFNYKEKTNSTDILIGFYSLAHGNPDFEPPFDGKNGTLAHTSYPTEYDLHLDDDESWELYPSEKSQNEKEELVDLFSVAIHEIGHKLGLKHSQTKTACLFPIYNHKSVQLDPDDIKGIQIIYGVKHNENNKETEIVDSNATEKPEEEEKEEKDHDDLFDAHDKPEDRPDSNKPYENRPDSNRPDSNRPDSNRPDSNRPDSDRPNEDRPNRPHENRPDTNRPNNRPHENRPHYDRPYGNRPHYDRPHENRPHDDRPDNVPSSSENQPIGILSFNPRRNINNRRELDELRSTPCKDLQIDSSLCLLNNKCLVISGEHNFWMNGRLRLMKRRKERNDVLFKGLTGRIDAMYRDNNLIHIIQGQNVTTYDSFYSEPIERTTLDKHFPNLPKYVKKIDSVFKKLSSGVIYIYSGELYWRYTKSYGLDPLPRLIFLWGIPSNVKSVLHFNNGRSIYIKNHNYWIFDESTNRLLSLLPGNLDRDFGICKHESFNIFDQFP